MFYEPHAAPSLMEYTLAHKHHPLKFPQQNHEIEFLYRLVLRLLQSVNRLINLPRSLLDFSNRWNDLWLQVRLFKWIHQMQIALLLDMDGL